MNAVHRIVLFCAAVGFALLSFWITITVLGSRSGQTGPRGGLAFAEIPEAQTDTGLGTLGIQGRVAFRQWDPSGKLTLEGVIHNTVHDLAKNVVLERIVSVGAQVPYDGIVAVGSDQDSAENGILERNVVEHLDGDPDTTGNQNPADGAIGTDFESEPGNGSVSVTFQAKADNVTVKQIVLTKGPEDDTLDGALAIDPEDIFAFVDVPNISLNAGDTVEYTWSIDVD